MHYVNASAGAGGKQGQQREGVTPAGKRDNSPMGDSSQTFLSLTIEVAQQSQSECRDLIAHGLREFNTRHFGTYRWTDLDVYVRDANGRVVGGAVWVAEGLRGRGVGSGILTTAEKAALEGGCRAVLLDTLSFQAPAFYEKRGYVRIGVVDDYRGGTQRIFMQKHLPSP